jgi:hypothetical protein
MESTDDSDGYDNANKDDDEVLEAEDEVVVDPLEKYEQMREEIQRERMVSHTFVDRSSTYWNT